MLTFAQLCKEIKDPIISMIPGVLALFEFNSGLIFVVSSLMGVISRIIEYIYEKLFCTNLENEYHASIEIHKYNERKNLNQTYRVVNWYIIRGINNSSIKVQRLVCNESSILDDDYIIRDEAVFHADYTIVPDEDYYVDIHWKDKKFQANHYIIGAKHDNPVYKIYGLSIDELKEFEEYCLIQHREYSKNIGKDVYKYFEWDLDDDEWCKRDIETEKTFDNIFIPQQSKEDIKNKIDNFVKSKDHYKKWGIPYKLGLVFHGYPGCGKTSTIYAIANHLGRSIYLLKLDTFETNSDLYRAARHIPRDAIVVIEDIDAHRVAHNRRPGDISKNNKKIPIIIKKKETNTSKVSKNDLREANDAEVTSAYSETFEHRLEDKKRIEDQLENKKQDQKQEDQKQEDSNSEKDGSKPPRHASRVNKCEMSKATKEVEVDKIADEKEAADELSDEKEEADGSSDEKEEADEPSVKGEDDELSDEKEPDELSVKGEDDELSDDIDDLVDSERDDGKRRDAERDDEDLDQHQHPDLDPNLDPDPDKDNDDRDDDDMVDGISRTGRIFRRPKNGKGKTIDSLLEIFDGYNYLPGAIVIITTNHLDAIDPALVRPGRMDHHYLFDYATPETVNDILDYFYVKASIESFEPGFVADDKYKEKTKEVQIDFSKYINASGQIAYNKLTTAEIINSIILPNIRDRKKTIAILENKLFSKTL